MPDDDAEVGAADGGGELADAEALLATIVAGIGGGARPGQQRMVRLVSQALSNGARTPWSGWHRNRQVGGLPRACDRPCRAGADPVVVATATLALQHQLVSRDLPAINAALAAAGSRRWSSPSSKAARTTSAVSACTIQWTRPTSSSSSTTSCPRRPQGGWRPRPPESASGPGHAHRRPGRLDDVDGQVWRAFAVTSRECVGATKCRFGECFAEQARVRAGAPTSS